MAKMGYQDGQGLGKEGHGIANPIEVKMRPQGAGVGAVKEKTQQARDEARRQAERRGEQYEDSSGEEREARRRKKDAAKYRAPGVPPPQQQSRKPKQKVRTPAEIEAEDGFEVPNVFKSLVDMTGSQPQLLTSTAGLMVREQGTIPSREAEQAKLAQLAQSELEAFAEAFRSLQERRKYVDLQRRQAQANIQRQDADITLALSVADAMTSLAVDDSSDGSGVIDDRQVHASARSVQASLFALISTFSPAQYQDVGLDQAAVASLTPLFKKHIAAWDPIDAAANYSSSYFPAILEPIRPILFAETDLAADLEEANLDDLHGPRRASLYESMILNFWLPKVRSIIVNKWSAYEPEPMLDLLKEWKGVLPSLPTDILVNQLVVQKLSEALRAWKPASSKRSGSSLPPNIWLFPWLSHLDEYHLDAKSSNGLLAEVKRKYRSAFRSWTPRQGVTEGLDRWLEVRSFRAELKKELELELLPCLARYLDDHFEVNPADQDIAPIGNLLKWLPYVKPEKMGRVLARSFFPKWMQTLHLWLTSDPNYEEVGAWFTWWQSQFPTSINSVPAIDAKWAEGLALMNAALELGSDKAKTELPAPEIKSDLDDGNIVGGGRPHSATRPPPPAAADVSSQGATFKDILEDLCEKEDLLLVPLRKAHPHTGLPLLRITASASGTGGVVLYIKGDTPFVQNRREKDSWEPMDLFEEGLLASLAAVK